MVGTARLRRPRRVQRRNVARHNAMGVNCSARYYAGGDAAAQRPYHAPLFNFAF